jgi:ABC-2 type transport system ATP-binding protein
MGNPVVETVDLTKAYDGTTVVDSLNLTIDEGEMFGFLGPNGAGKTTTILMLLGLTEPTSGVARISGFNSTREPLKVKRITGYVPERVGFYEDLTAYYNLAYTGRLNNISEEQIKKKVTEALHEVGLADVAEHTVNTFSRGMKQRLAIADLLVKEPSLAILDEPTSGIDPEGVNQILDLISKVAKERKMTLIISSHQLNQVQRICQRVGIIVRGKLVADGPLDELSRNAFGGSQFSVVVELVEATPELVDSIKKIEGVLNIKESGNVLHVDCSCDLRSQIARTVVDNNGLLVQMNIQDYALEDIYLKYFEEE